MSKSKKAKAPAKSAPKASEKKASPKAAPKKLEAAKVAAPVATSEDEDADDMDMDTAGSSGGDSGQLTPTISRSEESSGTAMTTKNFRNHPDMENFFRFIYEHDLRIEALQIIDQIITERKAKRAGKKAGATHHA